MQSSPRPLRFTNCQSELMDEVVANLVSKLEKTLGIACTFIHQPDWSEREALFDAGEIDVAWLCGLWYIQKRDAGRDIRPLVAPVMTAERYNDKPIYFSEIVVKKGRSIHDWNDLAGCHWAINEPSSHSGTNIVAFNLAQRGLDWSYFGQVSQSTAHSASVEGVIEGRYTAAAIDSTVLEQMSKTDPTLLDSIESIMVLEPSPMPPWVMNGHTKNSVTAELLTAAFASVYLPPFQRFAPITDADYTPLRKMHTLVCANHLDTIPIAFTDK